MSLNKGGQKLLPYSNITLDSRVCENFSPPLMATSPILKTAHTKKGGGIGRHKWRAKIVVPEVLGGSNCMC